MPRTPGPAGWKRLESARGAAGLLAALRQDADRGVAPGLWRGLCGVVEGTVTAAHRIALLAGRRLGVPVPPPVVRVPRTSDRTDPMWYSSRARGGSSRLAVLRALTAIAAARRPVDEDYLDRKRSALFRGRTPAGTVTLPSRRVSPGDFRLAVRRWTALQTGRNAWLALRLAELAARTTGDPAAALETLRVCGALAGTPRAFDPFNTLAAFLGAFHALSADGPAPLAALLRPAPEGSLFRKIAFTLKDGERPRSRRAFHLFREARRAAGTPE